MNIEQSNCFTVLFSNQPSAANKYKHHKCIIFNENNGKRKINKLSKLFVLALEATVNLETKSTTISTCKNKRKTIMQLVYHFSIDFFFCNKLLHITGNFLILSSEVICI